MDWKRGIGYDFRMSQEQSPSSDPNPAPGPNRPQGRESGPKRWFAGVASRVGAMVLGAFKLDSAAENAKAARDAFERGSKMEGVWRSFNTALELGAGAGTALKIEAQAASCAPHLISSLGISIPSTPLRLASLGWRVGKAEYIAMKDACDGMGDAAKARARLGARELTVGGLGIGISVAVACGMAAIAPGLVAAVAGIAVSIGFDRLSAPGLAKRQGEVEVIERASRLALANPVSERGAGEAKAGLLERLAGRRADKERSAPPPTHKSSHPSR